MRILYLHQYYCPNGGRGNDRSRAFAAAWAAAGHDVTVLATAAAFPPQFEKKDYFEENGVRVRVLNVAYRQEMGYARRIAAFLEFFGKAVFVALRLPRPDVVYASSTPPTVGWIALALYGLRGVPFVFETVDVWPDTPIGMGLIRPKLVQRILYAAVNVVYCRARAIVVLSEGMRAQVLRHGVPADKIHVLHNGTDVSHFRPAGAPPERFVAVYAGVAGRANDVRQIVEAARLLPDVAFRLYGWGAEWAACRAAAAGLENISFHDGVPKAELPAILQEASIGLVSFAPFEVLEANSANKFFDYPACGLPVVINYGGWQANYLKVWKCGLSAPRGDTAAFAAAIATLAADPALCAEMGRNARKLAEAKFDRKDLAARALELLRDAAE